MGFFDTFFRKPGVPEDTSLKSPGAAHSDEQKDNHDSTRNGTGSRESSDFLFPKPDNPEEGSVKIEDIFDYLLAPPPHKGADLFAYAGITPDAAVSGTEYNIEVTRNEACRSCGGSGSVSRQLTPCPSCDGKRQLQKEVESPHGKFTQIGPCPSCHGRGVIPQNLCSKCGGTGHIKVHRFIPVHIPAGVKQFSLLRFEGQGHAGEPDEKNGDLCVRISFT